jgi:AraC-like DNA-binding protein
VGIVQPPNDADARFYHIPSCKPDNPAIEQIGWFGLMILLGMVRVYTGPQWQPAEVGVMTHHRPCRYIREHFPHTRMRFSQPYTYVALDKALLSLPPLQPEAAMPESSGFPYEPLPDNFVGSLERILLSYIHDDDLNLELAAGLCNTSKRTLQRKLNETGSHYSDLLDRTRFHAAARLLQSPGTTITDIALQLGYSDAAHFARAFKRIAGVTPLTYRQQFTL